MSKQQTEKEGVILARVVLKLLIGKGRSAGVKCLGYVRGGVALRGR